MKVKLECHRSDCPFYLESGTTYKEEIDIKYSGFRYDQQLGVPIKVVQWRCPHCHDGHKFVLKKRENGEGDT